MLFNSYEFIIFLVAVFILYWFVFVKSRNLQNLFLLVASYLFYGWWDWRFLSLIAFSSVVDYIAGLQIYNSKTKPGKVLFLCLSIFVKPWAIRVFQIL